jgi:hypothetical protein
MVKKNGKTDYRSFTIEGSSIGFEGAKLISKTPGGAATKAANKLFRLIEKDSGYARFKNDKIVQFILREQTSGSSHKILAYDAKKVKLDEPIEREFPNPKDPSNPIVYKITHAVKVKALREHEVHSALKPKLGGAQ